MATSSTTASPPSGARAPISTPDWVFLIAAGVGIYAFTTGKTSLASTVPASSSTSAAAATATTLPSTPPVARPGAPVSLTQTGATTSSVQLSWAQVTGTVEYQVWQYNPETMLAQVTSNSATIQNLQANSHYTLFVVAIGSTGLVSSPSQPITVTTASTHQTATVPSIPGGFTVSGVSATSVTFSWLADSGATYYQIQDNTTGQVSSPIDGTTATISGLEPNTPYQFALLACNSVGCSNPSSLIQATTSGSSGSASAQPPAAPSGLQQTGATASSVTLGWSAVSGATTYTLVDPQTNTVLNSGISGTTVTITGLQPSTSYEVAVAACNTYGCSGASSGLTVTTSASSSSTLTRPTHPTGLQATAVTATSVTLGWNAVSGATHYPVIQVLSETDRVQRADVTQTTDTITGLQPSTAYTFVVQACNSAGCSGTGAAITVTTSASTSSASAPSTPAGLQQTEATETSVTVGWQAASGATQYTVEDVTTGARLTTAATAVTLSSLSPGTSYALAVSACNSTGCSAPATVTATTSSASSPAPSYPSYATAEDWHASMASAVGQFTNEIPNVRTPTNSQLQAGIAQNYPQFSQLNPLQQGQAEQAVNIGWLVGLNGLKTPSQAEIQAVAAALITDAGLDATVLDTYAQLHIDQTANLYLMEKLNGLALTPVIPATSIGSATQTVFSQYGL